jgi:hypothetical protein
MLYRRYGLRCMTCGSGNVETREMRCVPSLDSVLMDVHAISSITSLLKWSPVW